MKNLLVLIVTIIALIHMRCEDAQLEKNQLPVPVQRVELHDEQKQWLLALPAIIMEINRSSHDTLEAAPISEETMQKEKMLLQRDWGIANRFELLNAINRLEKYGTNATYQKLLSLIKKNKDNNIDPLFSDIKTLKEQNYLLFLAKNNVAKKNIDIVAWDWGRATSLIRWGYQVGYLSEVEAWNMLLHFGNLIQHRFTSWQEYGASYAYGRVFWASGFSQSDQYNTETQKALNRLFSEDGLWRKLKWNVDIST